MIFTIASGIGYTVGSPAAATVTITSADVLSATIAASTASIAENGGSSTLTVTLSTAPASDVIVSLTRSGTATIGSGNDYTQSGLTANTDPSYTLTVQATMTTATFTVTGVDDNDAEEGETAIFTIASGTGYTVGTPSAATVTISDDDDPVATIAAGTASIAEDGGASTLTVTLSVAPASDVTVNLTRSGTATIGSGNDYTQSGLTANTDPSYTLTVPATMATATFTVTGVDDGVIDAAETVIFTIASGTGYTVGTPSAATVTISDDDVPTATISAGTASIAEAGGSSTLTVTLSVAPANDVTVNLTRSGTATIGSGNDYTQSGLTANTDPSYTLTVQATMTTATFTVTGVDDNDAEVDETAIFTIASGAGYSVGTPSAATVTVTSEDAPSATISASPASIAEDGGSSTLTVTLNVAPASDVTVNLTRSGAATIGSGNDYTQSGLTANTDPSYTLTVSATMTTATFTVTGVDDNDAEGGETAIFTIASGTGYTPAATPANAATVTITDDDLVVTISAGTASVAENGGSSTLTVTLNAAPASNVIVNVTLGGTATFIDDYLFLRGTASLAGSGADYTLTVPATMADATFGLSAVSDTAMEADETVTFTIASGAGYTVGSPSSVTVTIIDDD